MSCKKIGRKSNSICVGDLKSKIKIIDRKIEPSSFSHTEDFSEFKTAFARVDTVSGGTFFNGVNTVDAPTHIFYIRFGYEVEVGYMLELKNNYYSISKIENLNEEDRFLKISCTKNGDKAKKANWK